MNVSLTRAGIYTSAEPSEDTLVCSEWDRLIIKEGTKYYIIPRSFDDEYEVKKVEINFASELGKDKYTWEKGKNSGDPICELVVDNLVDYELGDAICIDIEFERKDNPDDCYRFNTRINVLKSREGMLVSGCWYEDDFRQDVNDFSKQSSAVTFWDTGICLGIAAEIDGQNIITPITDISKLDIVRIVDGEETTVSSDVAHLNNTYESWDDKQQKDIEKKTQPGVYRLRIEEPGEYRIKYKNDSDPMFVTIYVDDPAGAYYTDKPESGNAMKNIINPNKDENFEYDENNRTFYFAFRPIQEKDDKGTVIRKYAYGNGQTEERQDGNGRNYNAAIESNGFVLCKNYHDDEKNIDVLEPIEDSDYALIEKIQENIGEYEVYKVTLGETYDGCGLMTRLVKKKLEWKGNGYSDQYLDDGWDDFYINIKEKRSGLMIGWLDGESFPEDLSKFDKTKDLDICWEHRVAMGMFTESENGDSVTPITGTLSLTDKAGKPVDDNASISEIGNGIYKFKTSVCGQYKVTYTTDDGEYSAYIFSKLPDIAFYSSNVPSDLNIVNSGAEEYIYEKGDTYYLCHNINEWQLKNKLDSITVSSPSFEEENVKNYKASELINNNVLDEIVITDDMEEAYYRITLNWKDNGHEQKDFHFMKAADGFAVGWPGNNDVCSTNPKDYQEQIHVNVRCHEWRTFANISINDEGEKVVEPIAATDINLAKFEITDIEGNNVDPEEAYIKFANKDGSDLDGIFELYFKNPGIYRVYYGDEYVTVRVAFVEVAFANKEGTYNEKDYEILSDDLFTAVMQPVDEEDFYIATFDGSGMGENSYNKATITGIKADNGIDKYFKCMISADGSSASVHVDREIGANRIEFEVTYKCIEYEKNDSTYVPRGDGWDGKDTFAIEIPEDPRELIEIGNDVSWNYEEPFIFDNEEKGVELTGFDEESAKFIDVTYTDNKKTDIGKYTAKAELKIKDDYKTEYKLPRQIPEELTSLEWEIVIPLNIKGLIDGINALPDKDKIKITDKANIESIRKSYDVLKDFEKAVVGKDVLKKLTDAEATIKDIEKNAKDAEQKATDDKLAAEKVNKLINALPAATSVKTTDEANIKAARTAYNALTADQKKLISADVLKKLTDVESALDKLKKNEEKPKKLLKVGDNIVDSNSKATYKVLVVGTKSKSGEVSIVKPNDAKVKKFSIPKNIYVDGVTYAVTEISANAFKGKNQLTTVTIPATVTKIGKNAFYGCKKLKKVKVPNIVTSIGVGAFQNCTSLTQATLGKGITAIPNDAFSGCKKLTSIVIPVEVKTIGKRAFYGCSALKNITVKTKKLKSVGSNALKGIRKDAVIKVPKAKVNDYRKVFRKKGQAATVMVVG